MEYNIHDRSTWNVDAQRVAMRYDQGLWSKPMVKMAVKKGVLTKAEYAELTGEAYA